ncbi:MAG: magnesium/cobalt transporter CorA [Candidatus Woesearchaeota archaeon]
MIDIFYLDKTVRRGNIKQLAELKNKPLWIDISSPTKEELELLQKPFKIHPLTKEDLLKRRTRIKIEEFPNYLFCVFYGIEAKDKAAAMVERDFLIGKNFVISSHDKEVSFYQNLKSNKDRLARLLSKGNDFLFHKLLDTDIDNYFPALECLEDNVEDLEEQVTAGPSSNQLLTILELKRNVLKIKRAVYQQREYIGMLAKNGHEAISKEAIPYFRDIYDHSIRVSDTTDSLREGIMNAFDVYMSSVSNSTNQIMKVLSVIATIALPLTVISSIYGTNFEFLPGSHNLYGFYAMVGLMLLVCVVMLLFFRKRNWF